MGIRVECMDARVCEQKKNSIGKCEKNEFKCCFRFCFTIDLSDVIALENVAPLSQLN